MPETAPSSDEPAYEHPERERPASAEPTELDAHQAPPAHDPYAAWRSASFPRFLVGNFTAVIGRQMTSVAVGWEMYRRTHSPTMLGLVGLTAALPLFLFTIHAGHAADKWQRKRIIIVTQCITFLTSVGLALLSAFHGSLPAWAPFEAIRHVLEWVVRVFDHNPNPNIDQGVVAMLALLLAAGTARTFGWAARSAFFPLLVPKSAISNAIMWNSSTFQTACAAGPAIGGFIIAKAGFPLVYSVDAVCALVFLFAVTTINVRQRSDSATTQNRDIFSGIRFVFSTKLILATITLDLFAVLLGGAVALLPIFADRLHVGPVGLGWLRAADSLGAIVMGIIVAHLPPMKRAGLTLLFAVTGYGLAIIGFGLSPYFWLSIIMLFLTGVCDTVSVVVRHTLVQLLTPDPMRGRVSAVNNVFIGSSNELGAFESGLTAGLFGPVASVVGGGIGTILAVIGVAWTWPELKKFGSFDSAKENTASNV